MFTAKDVAGLFAGIMAGVWVGIGAALVVPAVAGISLGENPAWYATRASGMIAYVLATASVLLGMATSMRLGQRFAGKGNIADLHRSLSLLTLIAIGAHVLFLALDGYANFTVAELTVPFVTWYRPFWTGLGIIAAYLAFAVYASFYARKWIGYKAWRSFHYATFGVWGLGTLHGLFGGTDTTQPWALGIYVASLLLVTVMVVYRFGEQPTVVQPSGGLPGVVTGSLPRREPPSQPSE